MSILKFALLGAAVACGINYLMNKREDGTSVLDDLAERAPEWMDKARQLAVETVDNVKQTINENQRFRS